MSNEIEVTVITPCYNSAARISKTIDSVLSQTFDRWELIVIDDASIDGSVDIIQKYCDSDSRIKLIKLEQNSGSAFARNKGIELAQGRYIAFLDSDDTWFPEKLDVQLQFMKEAGVEFSYTAYQRVNELTGEISIFSISNKVDFHSMLKRLEIGCLTVVYDTARIGKVFMPNIRISQDCGLWMKIIKLTKFAYGIDTVLASYSYHSNSVTAGKGKTAKYQWILYRKYEKMSLLKAIYYFYFYAKLGLLRYKFPRTARYLGYLR